MFGVYRPKLPSSRNVTAWITRNLHPHGQTIGLLRRLLRKYGYKKLTCYRRHICKPASRTS